MINPYYNPEKVNLEMIEFNDPNACYDYDTLCFWKTEDNLVFSASEGGCSCPIPFEGFSGETQKEIIQQLERIGSVEQGLSKFDSWNKQYDGNYLGIDKRKELEVWLEKCLKKGN